MAPHAWESFEVRGVILPAIRIVPECEWHRRKRRGAHELSFFTNRSRTPRVVEHVDCHTERPGLDFSAPDRRDRDPADEATDNIGAAGHGGQMEVTLDVAVHEFEAFGRQRTACRGHR